MRFRLLEPTYAVCRYSKLPTLPEKGFYSLTVTREEISLVAEEKLLPPGALKKESGFRALQIDMVMDLGMVGVMADIASILAAANVSLFAVSTYNTDYILVKNEMLDIACEALAAHGHEIAGMTKLA